MNRAERFTDNVFVELQPERTNPMNKGPTQAELYDATWKEIRAKAQNLANAYGKPVKAYREIVNNRPAGFKLVIKGESGPLDCVYLETIEPNAK